MCFYSIPHGHSFTFIWLKTSNFESSWPFERSVKRTNISLVSCDGKKPAAAAQRWPLNKGFLYSIILMILLGLNWPPNRGWPLNGWSLIRVRLYFQSKVHYLKCGGSSLIDKKSGHTPNLEDLKTATPSVLSLKDILSCCARNERVKMILV